MGSCFPAWLLRTGWTPRARRCGTTYATRGTFSHSWDGLGPIPDFDPWPHPHVQPAGRTATDRHRDARYSWLTYYADEFERAAAKHA